MSHPALLSNAPLATYLAKLERRLTLPDEDRAALLALPVEVQTFAAQTTIVKEGQLADHSIFLVEGIVSRQRLVENERQIISLSFPGDAIDLQTLFFRDADNSLVAHQPTIIASVPHRSLIELVAAAPSLRRCFGTIPWLTVPSSGSGR